MRGPTDKIRLSSLHIPAAPPPPGGVNGSSLVEVRRMTADTDRAAETMLGSATRLSEQADIVKG